MIGQKAYLKINECFECYSDERICPGIGAIPILFQPHIAWRHISGRSASVRLSLVMDWCLLVCRQMPPAGCAGDSQCLLAPCQQLFNTCSWHLRPPVNQSLSDPFSNDAAWQVAQTSSLIKLIGVTNYITETKPRIGLLCWKRCIDIG